MLLASLGLQVVLDKLGRLDLLELQAQPELQVLLAQLDQLQDLQV